IAMDDALAMRGGQCFRDLHRQLQRLAHGQRPFEGGTLDVLHHQIVGPDVVELTDARMVQRRNRASLALESLRVLDIETLDCDGAIDARVARLPDLAPPARAAG